MTSPLRLPRAIERVAERLVPPAAAEHVLGDLAETSASSRHYLRQLASVLPHVIWSQVRRRATIGGIVVNTILSGFFMLLFQRVPKTSFLDEPSAVPRLLMLLAIWVCGNALSAAYGTPANKASWNRTIFVATVAIVLGTAFVFDVPVLGVALAMAAVYGLALVLTMPWITRHAPPPLSLDTLPHHARLFQRVIWWRNVREAAGAVLVLGFNVPDLFRVEEPVKWTGHLLLGAGTLFIVGFLLTRAGARRPPANADTAALLSFHRSEIVRQRNVLRSVPSWYLLPFVPGLLLIMASRWTASSAAAIGGLAAVSVIFAVVWQVNRWAATMLEKQLAEVVALDPRG